MKDFKFHGKKWIGNICQKFEAICQEVDDVLSQNRAKYVEYQVDIGGDNENEFCFDVTHNSATSPMDCVKCENKVAPSEGNAATTTCINAVLSSKDNYLYTSTDYSPREPVAVDPAENQPDYASTDCHIVDQCNTPKFMDRDSESILSPGMIDDVLANEDSIMCNVSSIEKKTAHGVLGSISHDVTEPDEALVISESSNHNNEDKCVVSDPEVSDSLGHCMELQHNPKVGTLCDKSVDDTTCVLGLSTTSSETDHWVVSGKNTEPVEELNASAVSNDLAHQCECSLESLCLKLVVCHNSVDMDGCNSDSPETESERQLVSASCLLSPESVGLENASNSEIVSLPESSGQDHTWFCEPLTPSEASLPSFDLDDFDVTQSVMETIDLSGKMKLEESSVLVDDRIPYYVSCRAQKHRSYKKKIQEILASKKRLAKEYKLLGLWYGGIDIHSSQDTDLDDQNLGTNNESDSEWELI